MKVTDLRRLTLEARAPRSEAALHHLENLLALGFFVYFAWLSVAINNRPTLAPDQTLTFDHWWYFSERLRHGELAQWNPFVLFGHIAVQWNFIPLSLLHLPVLLTEPKIEYFPYYNAVGTFFSFFSIYCAGRIAGYGRLLPLVALALFSASGYRYASDFLHLASFLSIFPIGLALLVRFVEAPGAFTPRHWCAFGLLVALAISGLRLENIVYVTAFLIVTIAAIAFVRASALRARLRIAATGLLVLALALAADGWQLVYLFDATRENVRVALDIAPVSLFDGLLLKWMLKALLAQPAFLIFCANALYGLTRHCRRHQSLPISLDMALLIAALQGALLCAWELALIIARRRDWLPTTGENDRVWIVSDFVSVLVAMASSFIGTRRQPVAQIIRVMMAIFIGLAVSSYSWKYWPLNTQLHTFFMPSVVSIFMAVGAVGMWSRGRLWILGALLMFHEIGEIIALPMWHLANIPWNVPRAALAETAFQAFLMMEAVRTFALLLQSWIARLSAGVGTQLLKPYSLLCLRLMVVVASAWLVRTWIIPKRPVPDAAIPGIAWHQYLPAGTAFATWMGDPKVDTQGMGVVGSAIERIDASQSAGAAVAMRPTSGERVFIRYALAADPTSARAFAGHLVRFSVRAATAPGLPHQDFVSGLDIQTGKEPLRIEQVQVGADAQYYQSFVSVVPADASYILLTFDVHNPAENSRPLDVRVDDLHVEISDNVPNLPMAPVEDFPFAAVSSEANSTFAGDWMIKAAQSSAELRPPIGHPKDSWHRARVSDDVVNLSAQPFYYRFMPAYSQSLNTAPVYSSEIPRMLRYIFNFDLPANTQGAMIPHPEASPFVIDMTYEEWNKKGVQAAGYFANLTIFPHRDGDLVSRTLLAEAGSATRRAFVTHRVNVFSDFHAEHDGLVDHLQNGGSLADFVTTSDPRFVRETANAKAAAGDDQVEFLRDDPENVVLSATSKAGGYLVLLDLWDPGWSATVNGAAVNLYRGYMGLRFVEIPAGKSTVSFRYRVPGLTTAVPVSGVAWLCLLLGWGVSAPRERVPSRPARRR